MAKKEVKKENVKESKKQNVKEVKKDNKKEVKKTKKVKTPKKSYTAEVKDELKKVKWPTKQEMKKYSLACLIFIIIFGLYFYGIDAIFAWISSLVKGL